MSKTIKFKAVATSGRFAGGAKPCHGQIVHNESLGIDAMAGEFAQKAGIGVHEARMHISLFADYVMSALAEGKRMNFGGFELYLSMSGKIDGLNGKFDPSKNAITANIRERETLRAMLAELDPINVTEQGAGVAISSVLDERSKKENVLEAFAVCYASGGTFLVDAQRDDEGVWLERDDGEKVARAKVLQSTSTTLDFIFEEPLPPGVYRLAVFTRMGNPSLLSPACARRKVTVING